MSIETFFLTFYENIYLTFDSLKVFNLNNNIALNSTSSETELPLKNLKQMQTNLESKTL